MSDSRQIGELERALLERAERLAAEYLERGRRSAERIAAEAQERLHLRKEKEVLAAKAEAERLFGRRVQAAEIRLQGELDRLRWTLVNAALDGLGDELQALTRDKPRYREVLAALIRHAAEALGGERLVAQLNSRDRRWLAESWDTWITDLIGEAPRIELDEVTLECSGGVLLRTPDNRVRVNNTFEGRRERLAEALQEEVLERLFAPALVAGWVEHG
ncbi:MAG: hypothetical protein Kow006_19910 [Gammaproteobacteria bacterium]